MHNIRLQIYFLRKSDWKKKKDSWKNNSDQTYSSARDSRISASGDQIEGPPQTPQTISSTVILWGLRGVLKCSPIMPRDANLVYNS